MIFESSRDRARSPFRATFAGDAPSLVFPFTGRLFALDDWSTDGRWLIYHDAGASVLQAIRLDQPNAIPVVVARAHGDH